MNCSPPGSSVPGILQQEYWSRLPCPPPGDSSWSPALQAYSLPLSQYLSYSPKRREGASSEPVCTLNTSRVLLDPPHALFPVPHCGSYSLWIPVSRQMEWGPRLLSMIENYKYDWVNLIHVFFLIRHVYVVLIDCQGTVSDTGKKLQWWIYVIIFLSKPVNVQGFPGGSDGKESTCNEGHPGLILGSGRSPREGNGYALQYSCLENSMDRGAWWAPVYGVAKSQTWLSD